MDLRIQKMKIRIDKQGLRIRKKDFLLRKQGFLILKMHFQYRKLTVPVRKKDFHISILTLQFRLFDLNRWKIKFIIRKMGKYKPFFLFPETEG